MLVWSLSGNDGLTMLLEKKVFVSDGLGLTLLPVILNIYNVCHNRFSTYVNVLELSSDAHVPLLFVQAVGRGVYLHGEPDL